MTNRPELMDPALLRPGRLEAHHGLSHDSVGVGITLSGDGVQVVGDELRDGELVRPQVQRRRA